MFTIHVNKWKGYNKTTAASEGTGLVHKNRLACLSLQTLLVLTDLAASSPQTVCFKADRLWTQNNGHH